MIKKDIHLFTNLSKWMNIFYYCKKSDRVIGNRDLIANPFFQGYSRSDFDRILDHFLAKWSGFDCQSQKKWSVTTMIILMEHSRAQVWSVKIDGNPKRSFGLKNDCNRDKKQNETQTRRTKFYSGQKAKIRFITSHTSPSAWPRPHWS